MLVFGSQMHLFTLIVLVLELMALPFVLWYYFAWPKDKTRLWYFMLLVLLIFYNLTGGLFPDPAIKGISLIAQNIIAYGSGFLMAAYFPYYFYRAFELNKLRFHALYGAPLFLLLPYLVFFAVVYPLSGNLQLAITYGLIVPAVYSPILLFAIFYAIKKRFVKNNKKDVEEVDSNTIDIAVMGKGFGSAGCNGLEGITGYCMHSIGVEVAREGRYSGDFTRREVHSVYWAVSPWVLMTLLSYLQVEQWLEVLCTNLGFVVFTALYSYHSGRFERGEKMRLMEKDAMELRMRGDFAGNCRAFGLSARETEVALRLCQGWTYKAIAEELNISSRTVDKHAQNIFLKTGVNKKIDLQQILGFTVNLQYSHDDITSDF